MAVKVGRYGPFLFAALFPNAGIYKNYRQTAAATTAVKKKKK